MLSRVFRRLLPLVAAAGLLAATTPGHAAAKPRSFVRLLPGRSGCIAVPKIKGCQRGRAFSNPQHDPVISPDGNNLYVPAETDPALAILQRSGASGGLSQRPGDAGCLTTRTSTPTQFQSCAQARGISGIISSVAVSPDGRFAYVGSGPEEVPEQKFGAIAAFARDPSGQLTQLPDSAGCVAHMAVAGCALGPAFGFSPFLAMSYGAEPGPFNIAISPDGRNLYAAAGGVAAFARDGGSGALMPLAGAAACITEEPTGGCQQNPLHSVLQQLAITPDGLFVYARSSIDDGSGPSNQPSAVQAFRRDPVSGALTPVAAPAGCISNANVAGCTRNAALGPGFSGLALAPDGSDVYLATGPTSAAGSSAEINATFARGTVIGEFARDAASGVLTPLPGNAGCLSHTPQPACTTAPKLDGAQTIVVAPDGRSAFTAGDPNVDAFRRDPSSGALSLAARIKGCPDSFFSRACDRGPKALIKSPHGLAVSPDSREIYVTSSSFAETGVVAVIRRR